MYTKCWERGHILSLILSYENISNCSKIHCKCAGGPCLGSFWQSKVFCVQLFFFWRRRAGRASLELGEDRAVGQSRVQSVSDSRDERGWWVRCDPGCSAFGRMGWAGATPLLLCISTEEKAFKPKKSEDFLKRPLSVKNESPGPSRLIKWWIPGKILSQTSFICSCLCGGWTEVTV